MPSIPGTMAASKAVSQSLETMTSTTHGRPDPQPTEATEEQTAACDTTAEMPPGGRPRSNTLRREADLSALMSPVEKTELTALVARTTESMLSHVTQLFDPVRAGEKTEASRIASWGRLPYYLKDLSLSDALSGSQTQASHKENVKPPSRSKKAGRARDKRDAAPSAADDPVQQDADVAPRLQELKKEALLHFKKWQTAVHRRIGEISVKKAPDAFVSPGPKGRPPPNRRGRPGGTAPQPPGHFKLADIMPGPHTPTAHNAPVITVETDPLLMQLYPPSPTTLSSSSAEKRCLLLHSLLLLLLSIENYGAYTRVLLLNIASSLQLPLRILAEDEARVGGALAQIAKDIPPELLTPKKEDGKPPRRWKASAAGTLAGGSHAAALEAARIGSVFGISGIPGPAAAGLLGILAENGLAVGSIFGIYGARNSGKMMEHYLKDVSDLAFVPLHGSVGSQSEISKIAPESRRLRVILGISGWLANKDDPTIPWRCLGDESEVYAIRWELDALSKLGASFDTLVRSAAWSMAKKEMVARSSEFRPDSPVTLQRALTSMASLLQPGRRPVARQPPQDQQDHRQQLEQRDGAGRQARRRSRRRHHEQGTGRARRVAGRVQPRSPSHLRLPDVSGREAGVWPGGERRPDGDARAVGAHGVVRHEERRVGPAGQRVLGARLHPGVPLPDQQRRVRPRRAAARQRGGWHRERGRHC